MNAPLRRLIASALFILSFPLSASAQAALSPAVPTCALSVSPSAIHAGDSTRLSWTSTDAAGGSITYVGPVGPQGALNISPTSAQETTFVGTFTGPGGTVTCNVTVVVATPQTVPTPYSAGGTYSGGGGTANPNDTGTYAPTEPGYTLNSANFQTQPSNSQFNGTQQTVTSGTQGSGGGVFGWLVPCGGIFNNGSISTNPTDATNCNLCDLGQLIQNIINFLIIISIPISAALFAYAGFLYFANHFNPGGVAKAKKIFYSVIIGLVIALSGYLIVQSLLNSLLSNGFKTGGWSWNTLQCADKAHTNPAARPRNSFPSDIFKNLFTPNGTGGVTPTPTPSTGGTGTSVPVLDNISFSTDRSDAALQAGYTNASNYATQIQDACNTYGPNIPNCTQLVSSVCSTESGCQTTVNSNKGAVGLMQVLPTTASGMGFTCSLGDPSCNINAGTKYLSQLYTQYQGNIPNTLAAYNGGSGTQTGNAMSLSQDCPGLLAWQCSANPGGLIQTQSYVADNCHLLSRNGISCTGH